MEHLKTYCNQMLFSGLTANAEIEKIIHAIEETMQIKEMDLNRDYESIKIAYDNSNYYIPSGYAQNCYYQRNLALINKAKNIAEERDFNQEDIVWWNKSVLKLIQQAFDEKYFKEQVAHLRLLTTSGSKEKLKSLLHKFNVEQLKEYYQLISYGFKRLCLFVNEDVWDELQDHLSFQSSCIAGNDLLDELGDALYFFNYINRERIVEIILTTIEYHTFIAETVAEKLYNWGYDEAFMYLNTVT